MRTHLPPLCDLFIFCRDAPKPSRFRNGLKTIPVAASYGFVKGEGSLISYSRVGPVLYKALHRKIMLSGVMERRRGGIAAISIPLSSCGYRQAAANKLPQSKFPRRWSVTSIFLLPPSSVFMDSVPQLPSTLTST